MLKHVQQRFLQQVLLDHQRTDQVMTGLDLLRLQLYCMSQQFLKASA